MAQILISCFFCSFASMPGSSFQTSGGIQQTKSKSSRCHFGYVGSSAFCCVCFKKMDGTKEFRQVGSNLEKRFKSTCPRKRCQTLFEMILVFWCVESMLADYNMLLTTFFWLQDWNLLSHRCKSSCWKRPRCTISLQHELLACLETPETVLVVCVCACFLQNA